MSSIYSTQDPEDKPVVVDMTAPVDEASAVDREHQVGLKKMDVSAKIRDVNNEYAKLQDEAVKNGKKAPDVQGADVSSASVDSQRADDPQALDKLGSMEKQADDASTAIAQAKQEAAQEPDDDDDKSVAGKIGGMMMGAAAAGFALKRIGGKALHIPESLAGLPSHVLEAARHHGKHGHITGGHDVSEANYFTGLDKGHGDEKAPQKPKELEAMALPAMSN